jgi:Ca2+-binding RTX toxin-like protein
MRSQRITGSANTDDIRAKGGDDTIDVGRGDDVKDGSTGSDDICEGKAGDVFLKCEHVSVFQAPTTPTLQIIDPGRS